MRKSRQGFTLIELLIVVVIVGILALAAIPLITSTTRDARRAEAESQMGSMKGQARVAYSKRGTPPTTLTGSVESGGAGVSAAELVGQYYTMADTIGASGGDGTLTANPITAADGVGTHTFAWQGGTGSFSWP